MGLASAVRVKGFGSWLRCAINLVDCVFKFRDEERQEFVRPVARQAFAGARRRASSCSCRPMPLLRPVLPLLELPSGDVRIKSARFAFFEVLRAILTPLRQEYPLLSQ
jgi:hypothetical protein